MSDGHAPNPTASRSTYVGLFLITLATLMYEILLTRIFSVTLYYHLAFFAISVAMFGMTLGALIVYLLPGVFRAERVHGQLAWSSLSFAVLMVLCYMVHLNAPFVGEFIPYHYVALALPFTFGGIAVCLSLTRFPRQVGKLYAVDLLGAALGCVLLVVVLEFTDASTAVILSAGLSALGALFFCRGSGKRALGSVAALAAAGFLGFGAYNTVRVQNQDSLVPLRYVKGQDEWAHHRPEHIRWNAFSRIQVVPADTKAMGWGFGSKVNKPEIEQKLITIDASAATVMTRFDGKDLSKLGYLKYDVSNLAHHLRPDARVLAIGAGGGRDLLSALVFDQKHVTGVEINDAILKVAYEDYRELTGGLDKHPKVTLVHDEARSFIARFEGKVDILQVSMIDTWAATAAGAFVLTENSLYTVEAWQLFLSRLSERGVLSFTRWYIGKNPGEAYRVTSLATAALLASGVQEPRKHIALVKAEASAEQRAQGPDGVVTILVSKAPFTDEDLQRLDATCNDMGFVALMTPNKPAEYETFNTIVSGKDLEAFTRGFKINITPPTDDNPFFFNMLWPRDIFNEELQDQGHMRPNYEAVSKLLVLLFTVIGLTFACILVPLLVTTLRKGLRSELSGSLPFFLFFAGIGLGFLLIEISQMQRLILFLGHPTYGLSVVLFALLVSSGLGSYLTGIVSHNNRARATAGFLGVLLVLLVLFGVFTNDITQAFEASRTTTRILVAVAMLFPIGLLMGTCFPLGLQLASGRSSSLTPWLWGINGACSVCASVLATCIALTAGISTAFWAGFACYVLASLAAFQVARRDG